ncbi:ABC transporter permease [Desulfoplanes formicivorans]|uniref:ABC transporter permease n=1 Tax=Desulfoplanes formicivorans TaxID=1592317 RepID=A0A194AEI1_9BACT|nr:ABC transporter permease [Desulfoplanes formicivorans]GAU08487.1 ABC transporter permease [Desulfoplanes formicivorans]
MNAAMNISVIHLACFFVLLIIPGLLFRYLNLRLTRQMIIGFTRMIIQLSLVAVYLEYIFAWDSMIVNILWIMLMVLVANGAILRQSGLSFPRFITATYPCYALLAMAILASFLIVLDKQVLFSARYLIPLAGMIFGNILRTNVVALDRFYDLLIRREDEYMAYVSMGATQGEAIRPFVREACRAAFGPQLASVSTMGLVALPGMMTGQILGGSSPAVAIKYQLMIMVAIFLTSSLSSFLTIMVSALKSFDAYGRLNRDMFLKDR